MDLQIFQLKVDGVAFRLIPEFSQIKNAIQVRILSCLRTINMYLCYIDIKVTLYFVCNSENLLLLSNFCS